VKAITIRQPWATLIALGVKTIETRSWRTHYRGPVAIHAGAAMPIRGPIGAWVVALDDVQERMPKLEHWEAGFVYDLPIGAVIATATLADCVPIVGLADCHQLADHHLCTSGDNVLEHWPMDGRHVDDTEKEHGPQRPYGDYAPGGWGWLLTNVQPIAPVPAKGKLGLWEWQP